MSKLIFSRVLIGVAGAAIVLTCAADSLAQINTGFQYVYDDLGQVIKVIDSGGNQVDYIYDAVGNTIEIKRSATVPGSLVIFNLTPQRGTIGETVRVQGQGFSPTVGANVVRFNGILAKVLSAGPNTLVVMVPDGATTGPIVVTVGTASATSSSNFIVVPVPLITSLNRKSALSNTTIPNLTVTGSNLAGAVFSFQTTGIAIVATSANPPGASAHLSVGIGAVAGTFALVATNSFGSSTPGITRVNSFTVVNPNSTADSDGDGVPDVLEAMFGTDPLDPGSVPNTSFLPSGEIEAEGVSVLNTGGTGPGQPTTAEAHVTVFSALNLAGMTGGQPVRMEADGLVVSVLNTAPGAPLAPQTDAARGSGGGAGRQDGSGGIGTQPVVMETDAIAFSVNNTAASAPPAGR